MGEQELRLSFDARQPQKSRLSADGADLVTSRPRDVSRRERIQQVDVDWRQLESSLDNCQQLITSIQTTVLPCWQAASELSAWMDGVETTVKAESCLQPQTAGDVTQLHDTFKVPVLLL